MNNKSRKLRSCREKCNETQLQKEHGWLISLQLEWKCPPDVAPCPDAIGLMEAAVVAVWGAQRDKEPYSFSWFTAQNFAKKGLSAPAPEQSVTETKVLLQALQDNNSRNGTQFPSEKRADQPGTPTTLSKRQPALKQGC